MENLIQRLNQVKDRSDARNLFLIMEGVYESMRSQFVVSAGLRIGGTTTLVRTAATASVAVVNGVIRSIDAATDMPALVGTVENGTFNIFVFTLDRAGTFYTQMGTAGATLPAVRWPKLNPKHAIVGFVIINPTGTGDFVGGTTALADATVAPNAVYVSPIGAFRPNADTGI
jgi:hypothetical protein